MIKNFYEDNIIKVNFLKRDNKIQIYEIIHNNEFKQIMLKKNFKFQNKDYVIRFKNDKNNENIKFNPFDYCFEKLFNYPLNNINGFKEKLKICEIKKIQIIAFKK